MVCQQSTFLLKMINKMERQQINSLFRKSEKQANQPSLSNDRPFGHYFQKNKPLLLHPQYTSVPILQSTPLLNISLECCDVSDEEEHDSRISNKTMRSQHS